MVWSHGLRLVSPDDVESVGDRKNITHQSFPLPVPNQATSLIQLREDVGHQYYQRRYHSRGLRRSENVHHYDSSVFMDVQDFENHTQVHVKASPASRYLRPYRGSSK